MVKRSKFKHPYCLDYQLAAPEMSIYEEKLSMGHRIFCEMYHIVFIMLVS
jgi:hypothetical protein